MAKVVLTDQQKKELAVVSQKFPNAETVVLVATAVGLPIHFACALLEKESGGRNVFGHDGTSSIPDAWKGSVVTKAKYQEYLKNRAAHGAQGVGPCQLTYPGYQDQADAAGGCWRPAANMRIGFGILKDHIQRYGIEAGAAAYNGAGPAAEAYGRDFVVKADAWKAKFS